MSGTDEINVLLVEDSPADVQLIAVELSEHHRIDFNLRSTETLLSGIEAVQTGGVDVVLLDLGLPDSTSSETCQKFRHQTDKPIIVITENEEAAVSAMTLGAQQSLIKGRFDGETLRRAIRTTLACEPLRKALLQQRQAYRGIIENHPDGVIVLDRAGVVLYANESAEVLFSAEEGTLVGNDFGFPLANQSTLVTLIQRRANGPVKITAEFRTAETDWEDQPATVVFVRDVTGFAREQEVLDFSINDSSTRISSRHFQSQSLREQGAELYHQLAEAYGLLLEEALEQRAFKSDDHFSDHLAAFTDRLSSARPGPRDLIELHTAVLREKLAGTYGKRAQAYLEEGRLMLLNIMGRLVTYYRPYALAGTTPRIPPEGR